MLRDITHTQMRELWNSGFPAAAAVNRASANTSTLLRQRDKQGDFGMGRSVETEDVESTCAEGLSLDLHDFMGYLPTIYLTSATSDENSDAFSHPHDNTPVLSPHFTTYITL